MKAYLHSLLEPMLANPQALQIAESTDDQGDLLSVSISKPDMGRVIGKSGETIKAIRTVIHTLGSMNGKKVSVKVLEPVA